MKCALPLTVSLVIENRLGMLVAGMNSLRELPTDNHCNKLYRQRSSLSACKCFTRSLPLHLTHSGFITLAVRTWLARVKRFCTALTFAKKANPKNPGHAIKLENLHVGQHRQLLLQRSQVSSTGNFEYFDQ